MIKGVKHMRPDDSKFATVPVGKLGIIVHPSCAELGKRIDQYIVNWRKEREHEHKENVVFKDYEQDTYIIDEPSNRSFFNLLQNITMPDGRDMSFAAFWHANGTSRNTTFESFVLEIMSDDWLALKRMKEKSFTENNLVYFAMFVLVVLVATLVTIILKRQIIPARLSFT